YLGGYVCSKGHAFWLDDAWPSPPDRCPCCGEKSIKRTWAGIVRRGFSFFTQKTGSLTEE
ncbi:MAG: hypothetical protein K6T65_14780, partial [Peptococcaceae bacterium]|nr:hypothetical protein [Peptococcaceae bacterium]